MDANSSSIRKHQHKDAVEVKQITTGVYNILAEVPGIVFGILKRVKKRKKNEFIEENRSFKPMLPPEYT